MQRLYSYLISFFLVFIIDREGAAQSIPTLWNLPHQSLHFIGRENPLKQIKKKLNDQNILFITGMNGIGKTELSLHYAHTHIDIYDIVWKFNSSNDMGDQYKELFNEIAHLIPSFRGQNFTQKEQYIKYVMNWLRKTEKTWLIIFDDVRNNKGAYKYVPESHRKRNKHVLITTTKSTFKRNKMPLKKFNSQESIAFLKTQLEKNIPENELFILNEALDGHPLALKQAAAYLNNVPHVTVDKYLEKLKNAPNALWSLEKELIANSDEDNPPALLSKSIIAVIETLKLASPEAYRLLQTLCLLNTDKIETSLILKGFENQNAPESLALKFLKDYYLIEENFYNREPIYSIHRYIKYVVLSLIKENDKERQEIPLEAAALFADIKKESIEEAVKYFCAHTNHITHLKSLFENSSLSNDLGVSLKIRLIYYLYYFEREYTFPFALARQIEKDLINHKENNIEIARFRNFYSYMKYAQGTLEEAIQEAKKSQAILLRINSPESQKELMMLLGNNLGIYYLWQGELDKCQECVEILENLLKNNDYKVGKVVLSLLKIDLALQQGHFEEGLKTSESLYNFLSENQELYKVAGYYLHTLTSLLFIKANKLEEATFHARRAFNQAFKAAGNTKKHESVARACCALALCEMNNQNLAEAEKLIKSALSEFDRFYGDKFKNPRQAMAHKILGDIEGAKGNNEKALEAYQFSETIYNKILKNHKIDDVSELYKKIIELGIKLNDSSFILDYVRKHKSVFGLEHSRTVEIARILDSQGITIKW